MLLRMMSLVGREIFLVISVGCIISGKDLLKTDLQYSDNFLLLAVHLLLDVWVKTGQYIYYVCVLEYCPCLLDVCLC